MRDKLIELKADCDRGELVDGNQRGIRFLGHIENSQNVFPGLEAFNAGTGPALFADGRGNGLAGFFIDGVDILGNLSKLSGSFKIDHPLDPANKYLYHSLVESPDMMNIYNGNATLDDDGEAWVELPAWFQALNKDFRYQLTCIGGFAQAYIAEKVQNYRFKIAGGSSGLEVSWQVTGIRHDPYAEQNRIPLEEEKTGNQRGRYRYPQGLWRAGGNGDEQLLATARKSEAMKSDSGCPMPAF